MDEENTKNDTANNEFGLELDVAVSQLRTSIENSVDFLSSDFGGEWERAERYYKGQVDMPDVENRSTVVKTEVRDTIRALKPSILRTLLHARKPVEYMPNSVGGAGLAEQQSLYVTQLFWQCGGYKALMAIIDESLLKKGGFVKAYWEEDPLPVFSSGTGLTSDSVQSLVDDPNVDIEELTEEGNETEVPTFSASWRRYHPNGKIVMEAVPTYEVFFPRNASDIQDSIHGQRRDVTVGDAIEMGLDYDDWRSLDSEDPEQTRFSGESKARRGYSKDNNDPVADVDLTQHKFLLTECYAVLDLDGTGRPKHYLFYLGGTSYTYLDHIEVEETDWGIQCIQCDPVPFTVLGNSVAELVMSEQDTQTSILRAMVDNAHMSNNPRPNADPRLVDFNDLMNNGIGAPIKTKNGGTVEYSDVPFVAGQMLPFLQYLESDTEDKTGVTKASQGLDPDAMQSTDKEAVKNTIMLGQGQVELIVRNILESIIPLFNKLLRLSIRHMDPVQTIRSKGQIIPVAPAMFDPNLFAEPKIGLGTTQPEIKMSALQFVLAKQESILSQFGFDNPFTSLSQMYNTLEDLTELSGLSDVGRYFKVVTPEIEKQLAQQRAAAAKAAEEDAKANAPMDPSKALTIIEGGKTKTKEAEIAAKTSVDLARLQLDALTAQENADLERDKMIQERALELVKLQDEDKRQKTERRVAQMQERNSRINTDKATSVAKEFVPPATGEAPMTPPDDAAPAPIPGAENV